MHRSAFKQIFMEDERIPGASWCLSTRDLRRSIRSMSLADKRVTQISSEKITATVRRNDCLHIYSISDTPSDILLIGSLLEQFRYLKGHETARGFVRPVMLVIVNESRPESLETVLDAVKQRTGKRFEGTSDSKTWTVKAEGSQSSRVVVTLGSPCHSHVGEQYWALVAEARSRIVDLIEICILDVKQDRLTIYSTSNPVLLSSLPEPIINRIDALIMTGTIKEDTGEFCIHNSMRPYVFYLQGLFTIAKNRFPVLLIDYSFSSSGNIRSLHHLSGFTRAWPKLLPPTSYLHLLQNGLDGLYLNMMRLAGAFRKQSGSDCVEKAREMVRTIDPDGIWAEQSIDENSFHPVHCNLKTCIENGPNLGAAMNCPVDSPPDSLAVLIPLVTEHIPSRELVAVKVTHERAENESDKVKFALSTTSPTHLLLLMDKDGSRVDDAIIKSWKKFISTVKRRNTPPKVHESIAHSWKDFLTGTVPLVQWLVDDEKERNEGRQDTDALQANARNGDFTVICKRSL